MLFLCDSQKYKMIKRSWSRSLCPHVRLLCPVGRRAHTLSANKSALIPILSFYTRVALSSILKPYDISHETRMKSNRSSVVVCRLSELPCWSAPLLSSSCSWSRSSPTATSTRTCSRCCSALPPVDYWATPSFTSYLTLLVGSPSTEVWFPS